MFLSDAQVRVLLAGQLKVPVASLKDYWSPIILRSHASAYQEIQRRFLRRGFTQEQVDGWDSGPEFEGDLAVFWCLVRGASVEAFDLQTIKTMDRRSELDTVQVFVRGQWVRPDAGPAGPGTVNSGPQDGGGTFGGSPSDIRW